MPHSRGAHRFADAWRHRGYRRNNTTCRTVAACAGSIWPGVTRPPPTPFHIRGTSDAATDRRRTGRQACRSLEAVPLMRITALRRAPVDHAVRAMAPRRWWYPRKWAAPVTRRRRSGSWRNWPNLVPTPFCCPQRSAELGLLASGTPTPRDWSRRRRRADQPWRSTATAVNGDIRRGARHEDGRGSAGPTSRSLPLTPLDPTRAGADHSGAARSGPIPAWPISAAVLLGRADRRGGPLPGTRRSEYTFSGSSAAHRQLCGSQAPDGRPYVAVQSARAVVGMPVADLIVASRWPAGGERGVLHRRRRGHPAARRHVIT